jgi:rod shape determining protein RodA
MGMATLLRRLDYRMIFIIFCLMGCSLLVISANTGGEEESFFTTGVKHQIKAYTIGWGVFFLFALMDYNKLREWTWGLYLLMILLLVGLFFTDSIQRVHRWYKIPWIGFNLQPSEFAKLIVVIALSWFLERNKSRSNSFRTTLKGLVIVAIPFFLILKQPDLGTALVLLPITLVMFYFGNFNRQIISLMTWSGAALLALVALIFLKILSHEELRPYATVLLKDYQFDRLDPDTHHQRAAQIAIGVGGLFGTGFRRSEFTGNGWLPAPYTDSVFPAFGEEFGLVGLLVLLALFYALIAFGFQISIVAKDLFGKLLSAGVTAYLAMHIMINIGMMSGFLPITGVPLVLVTYGGSSVFSTMMALGILQSIYARRFMF